MSQTTYKVSTMLLICFSFIIIFATEELVKKLVHKYKSHKASKARRAYGICLFKL